MLYDLVFFVTLYFKVNYIVLTQISILSNINSLHVLTIKLGFVWFRVSCL